MTLELLSKALVVFWDFDGVIKFLFILPKEKSHPFFDKKGKLIEFNLGLDGNFVLRDGKWISANDIQ